MRFHRHAHQGLITGMLLVCLGLVLAAGCGNESTKPVPVVKAMGGILLTRGTPSGVPFGAAVVVSVDGQIATDAQVTINGAGLTYIANPAKPEETGYVGLVSAQRGDVLTLSVTAANQTVTLQATVPGMVELHPPAGGLVYTDGQEIPITWDPPTGAVLGVVSCAGATAAPSTWMVAATATGYTVPASATTVPGCRISVLGLAGTGDLPTARDQRQWAGKNGFWITCQDYVDVMITG